MFITTRQSLSTHRKQIPAPPNQLPRIELERNRINLCRQKNSLLISAREVRRHGPAAPPPAHPLASSAATGQLPPRLGSRSPPPRASGCRAAAREFWCRRRALADVLGVGYGPDAASMVRRSGSEAAQEERQQGGRRRTSSGIGISRRRVHTGGRERAREEWRREQTRGVRGKFVVSYLS